MGLSSAKSFKRSRRELSIDVTENRSTLKNYQNTLYARFSFSPKKGDNSLKQVFLLFYVYFWVSLIEFQGGRKACVLIFRLIKLRSKDHFLKTAHCIIFLCANVYRLKNALRQEFFFLVS